MERNDKPTKNGLVSVIIYRYSAEYEVWGYNSGAYEIWGYNSGYYSYAAVLGCCAVSKASRK
jgi:hypothetical protein